MITLISISLIYKKKAVLFASFAVTIVFALGNVFEKWQNLHQKQIIVYNTGKYTSIDFIDGQSSILLTSLDSIKQKKTFSYNIEPAHDHLNIENATIFNFRDLVSSQPTPHLKFTHNYIQFYKKRITLVTPETPPENSSSKWATDYLILANNPRTDIAELQEQYQFKRLIIAASNFKENVERWIKSCEELNVPYINCKDKAFVEELE